GNDELHAGDGNDTETGGPGDDLLDGGAGADMYVFHRGDGNDVIVDSGDNFDKNFISFGPEVDLTQVHAVQDGTDMVITYGPGDSIRVRNWNPAQPTIREIVSNDNPATAFTVAQVQNFAPVSGTALANQSASEDQAFSYAVPSTAFSDPEGGSLSYAAGLPNGNALPSWLGFDPQTRTFSGTPENVDVGAFDVRVTANDPLGASASQSFHLTVVNTNDAPLVANPQADQLATEDQPFQLTLAANEFADPDAGDHLTLSASLE